MLISLQLGLVAFASRHFHRKCLRNVPLIWVWKLRISDYNLMSRRPMNQDHINSLTGEQHIYTSVCYATLASNDDVMPIKQNLKRSWFIVHWASEQVSMIFVSEYECFLAQNRIVKSCLQNGCVYSCPQYDIMGLLVFQFRLMATISCLNYDNMVWFRTLTCC